MGEVVNPVESFLARKTFHCEKMNANLTPDECCARQKRKIEEMRYGRKITLNADPQSKFCRSGECQQGLVQLGKMRARKKARAKRRAEAR